MTSISRGCYALWKLQTTNSKLQMSLARRRFVRSACESQTTQLACLPCAAGCIIIWSAYSCQWEDFLPPSIHRNSNSATIFWWEYTEYLICKLFLLLLHTAGSQRSAQFPPLFDLGFYKNLYIIGRTFYSTINTNIVVPVYSRMEQLIFDSSILF